MEQITKNAFIDALQSAAAVALVWAGFIEKDRVFNDIQRIKDYTPVYDRHVKKVQPGRVCFEIDGGELSYLAYYSQTIGREHYKDNNVYIRVENYKDYKPNIIIYKIK